MCVVRKWVRYFVRVCVRVTQWHQQQQKRLQQAQACSKYAASYIILLPCVCCTCCVFPSAPAVYVFCRVLPSQVFHPPVAQTGAAVKGLTCLRPNTGAASMSLASLDSPYTAAHHCSLKCSCALAFCPAACVQPSSKRLFLQISPLSTACLLFRRASATSAPLPHPQPVTNR